MEVLVALVIVAVAGGAVLNRTRALLDYQRRVHERQETAHRLLNQVAWLNAGLSRPIRIELKDNRLYVEGNHPETGSTELLAVVENHADSGQKLLLPPIDQAYSPTQLYRIRSGEQEIPLLLPNLPPPSSWGIQ